VDDKLKNTKELIRFQITMWKMNHGKMPLMLSSVEIKSEQEFEVYRN
jgi:hypothetical protein